MEHSGWQVIATFEHPAKAHIIKGMLESEGIHSVITNDTIVTIMPFFSPSVGGIQLLVNEADVMHAKELMDSFDIDSEE